MLVFFFSCIAPLHFAQYEHLSLKFLCSIKKSCCLQVRVKTITPIAQIFISAKFECGHLSVMILWYLRHIIWGRQLDMSTQQQWAFYLAAWPAWSSWQRHLVAAQLVSMRRFWRWQLWALAGRLAAEANEALPLIKLLIVKITLCYCSWHRQYHSIIEDGMIIWRPMPRWCVLTLRCASLITTLSLLALSCHLMND